MCRHTPARLESWLGTGDGMQTLLLAQQALYLYPLPQSVSVRENATDPMAGFALDT